MSQQVSQKNKDLSKYVSRLFEFGQRLVGTKPMTGRTPITSKEYSKVWDGNRHSITDYLSWVEYSERTKTFLLNDGVSNAACLEVRQVNVEGRTSEFIEKVRRSLVVALNAIPEVYDDSPWIVQFYLMDEPIESVIEDIKKYTKEEIRESKYSQAWFETLDQHIKQLSRESGLFEDEIAGIRWRGLTRKARVVIYRRTKKSDWVNETNQLKRPGRTPANEVNQLIRTFGRALQSSGLIVKRMEGSAFYEWMAPFFSPAPKNARDGYEWSRAIKRFPSERRSQQYDLGQSVFSEEPDSDDQGRFWFCGKPTQFLSIAPIEKIPDTGVITAEIKNASGKEVSLWDELPRGSMFSMTIVIETQGKIKTHLNDIISAGGKATREASLATEQAGGALNYMANGERVYRVFPGVYVRADNEAALDEAILNTMTVLSQSSLSIISPRYDAEPINAFLRSLPMCYDYKFDRSRLKRAWLCTADDISALLPLYGRSTGTGHPGFFFFNRVGEPFMVDPLNKRDRSLTAHLMLFGPTGAGKSATANYLLQHVIAVHNPRVFIIDKGNSFGRLGKYLAKMGKSVNHLRFTPSADISLPPYAETQKALEQLRTQESQRIEREKLLKQRRSPMSDEEDTFLYRIDGDETDDGSEEDEQRNYLGEMENLTVLMVTGAKKQEEEKLTQADRALLSECLVDGLKASNENGALHATPSDVVAAMENHIKREDLDDSQKLRLREMKIALSRWTTGTHGHYFNRYGKSWPEADCTIVDMGILTGNNNDDMLAVAVVSLINTITGLGEKYQSTAGARENIVLVDEGHVITKNPTLAKPFVFGLKTWRKLAIWLWQSTQNLADYPDEAETMLSLAEWWICLRMESEHEIEQIARFKKLTKEDRKLLSSARKQDGAFTEGVLLGSNIRSLFRVVMPALPLVLSMTDTDQKKAISELARINGTTEIGASNLLAEQIIKERESA